MTTRQAARAAVRTVIRSALAELVENSGPEDEQFLVLTTARRKVEAAVRRQRKLPAPDLVQLECAVLAAAPESHRDQVAAALRILHDAETAELEVEQGVGFAIGVAIGQAFREDDGWDLISWFDAVPSLWRHRRHR